MEFLAFPAAGVGILLLWAAGVPLVLALFLGPAVSFGLLAVALQLLWPNTPGKKTAMRRATDIRIARKDAPRRSPANRERPAPPDDASKA